jgi:NAD(P)-dependent dehydrogenase (short-subunit alcohol dehydrogenase family)
VPRWSDGLAEVKVNRPRSTYGGYDLSLNRWILPVCVLGSAATNFTERGYLKGAMVAFTRSLAGQLADKGIRVNGVAPGPIWTPLIPASFDAKHVGEFGQKTPLGRPGQPDEVAPCFVFLASSDSSYMTGQVLHPNGGEIING